MNDAEKILKIIAESDAIVAKGPQVPISVDGSRLIGPGGLVVAHVAAGPGGTSVASEGQRANNRALGLAHARNAIEPTNAALKIAVEHLVQIAGIAPSSVAFALRAILAEMEKKS